MSTFTVQATGVDVEIPEIHVTITSTPVDLVTLGVGLPEIHKAQSLFNAIDSGSVTASATGVGFSSTSSPKNPAFEITGTGTQALTTTPATVDLSTVLYASPDYSVTGGTITYSGTDTREVIVDYYISAQVTNNNRSTARHAVFQNNVEITPSRTYSYHRTVLDGWDTGSKRKRVTLAPGDTIQVRSEEVSANEAIVVLRTESTILITDA